MSLLAGPVEPVPPMVSPFTPRWSAAWHEIAVAALPTSNAYESANRAAYVPIAVLSPVYVRRVWWANGADTAGGATVEVGLYRNGAYKPGAKIISGSAVQGTASQIQFVDITDTLLTPDLYWIAVVASSAANTTLFRSTVAAGAAADAAFRMSQVSAYPLPATATPTETNDTNIYLCGFSTTTIT